MGRDRTQQATPDLFSTASFRDSSLPAKKQDSSAQKQRHVLPKDLSNAVKHLNDQELDLLAAACLEEAKRRGRLPRGQANRDESAPKWFSRTEKSSHRQHVEAATVSLTRGQRAAEAKDRAAQASEPSIKRAFQDVAAGWIVLAEQAEWMDSEKPPVGDEEK